jgi:hypothetical protein
MTGDYHGLPTRILSNQHLRLEFLAEAGPRIVRLMLAGSDENLLAETPDLSWPTPYGEFRLYGGHRLWHAPEASPRTAFPDKGGLVIEELGEAVRLCGPTESHTGIRKRIEISLLDGQPGVTLVHTLHNDGMWPVELAPWAITQLPLGGIAILPQRSRTPDTAGLVPDRHVVLWPYASWQDPRLQLGDDYVLVRAEPRVPPLKLGYLNERGWAAYLRAGILFVKRFEPQAERVHADRNCNVEVYCKDRFIELETLGPLVRLEPGQWVTHIETLELYCGMGVPQTTQDTVNIIHQMEDTLSRRTHGREN